MAVAFGSAGTYLTYGSRTNSTLVAPASIANGDLLIAYIVVGRVGSYLTPTPPAGWRTLTGSPTSVTDTTFYGTYSIFYKIAASESGNYTFTHATASSCGVVIRYTGVNASVPFSPTPTTNSGTGSTATATGFTTAFANTLVIFTEHDWGDNTTDCTPPAGTTPTFTERLDATLLYVADGTLATAGATGNKAHTNNNISNPWAAYLVGLTDATDIDCWVAAVTAAGGSVSGGRQTLVGNLIAGLKTDGIWDKLDRLWLFAAENTQSALIDIKTRATATAVNTPTFTTDVGYAGNGSSSYIDSNFNPSTGTPIFAQNSACAFGWSNTAGTDAGPLVGGSVTQTTRIYPAYVDTNAYYCVNTGSQFYSNPTGPVGLYSANRSGASAQELYINGSSVSTSTNASAAIANGNLYALQEAGGFSARQIRCLGVGSSLNATEQGNLYTRLNTYMTGVTAGGATTLTAAAGSYAITGTAAALLRKQVAAAGSYTITGTAAALLRKQVAAAGSYTITGTAAALLRKQVAAAGSYTITGTAAALLRKQVAAAGSYTLTGSTATFAITANVVLPVATGAYTITGAAAAFQIGGNVVLATDPGAYTLTGTAATFAIGGNVVLAAAAGAYTLTGSPASFIDSGVEPPVVGLPGGGGGFSARIDYGRKKRRRYRALEEIEKRLDERIERLEAEAQEKQQEFATVLGSFSSGQTGELVSEQYENLLRQQAQITAMLHEAQKRAEKVRQEKIQLAQLARQAAEAIDEDEAITMLLLT